jgi:D-glycero-D-manno-heptose 1,7-bisphosphate phosphatase
MSMKTAVFLDRDGTLVEEGGYIDRVERLVFFPYSVDAIRLLNRGGHVVVMVTNQSGVARGIFAESFVAEAHEYITERLAAGGARIDAFYYCPHHAEGIVGPYRRACDCRKPGSGMLTRAAADLGITLERSFVVGDRWNDLEAGQTVGAQGLLVRTGYGRIDETSPKPGVRPAAVVDNLIAAASWILHAS